MVPALQAMKGHLFWNRAVNPAAVYGLAQNLLCAANLQEAEAPHVCLSFKVCKLEDY
jgi:hypothetical protein